MLCDSRHIVGSPFIGVHGVWTDRYRCDMSNKQGGNLIFLWIVVIHLQIIIQKSASGSASCARRGGGLGSTELH